MTDKRDASSDEPVPTNDAKTVERAASEHGRPVDDGAPTVHPNATTHSSPRRPGKAQHF